jgi:hypothetical protein
MRSPKKPRSDDFACLYITSDRNSATRPLWMGRKPWSGQGNLFSRRVRREAVSVCHNGGMQTLRKSTWIAKLVLVWFALFLGSAMASALIQPDGMQIVCAAGGGMKMVSATGDDGELHDSASMDCPLCASVAAPPSNLSLPFEKPSSLAHALRPIAAAHIASVTAPPLPSRGPPASLLSLTRSVR